MRKTRQGAVPSCRQLRVVGGAVFSGSNHARVLVRRWPEDVSLALATAGVALLVRTMYGGQRERIVLPRDVAAVAFG